MKVALVTRSTLFSVRGGDTVQVEETARHLQQIGVNATIVLTHELNDPAAYDLIHFFNITRPADILKHVLHNNTPYVVTPIWIDYAEYDRHHRSGLSGKIFNRLHPTQVEYIKAIARWFRGKDKYPGHAYVGKGHTNSIRLILERASALLPNSTAEYEVIREHFPTLPSCTVVSTGVDDTVFQPPSHIQRNNRMVLCAARIEGIKNQLQLIRALNSTEYDVLLIGDPAPNQRDYYNKCRRAAASNIQFIPFMSHSRLVDYYQQAAVHVLPSWYESCGLASLEAAAAGCRVVATRKGFASSFLGDDAFYCEPSSTSSIRQAVDQAMQSGPPVHLQQRIRQYNSWELAAHQTSIAYKKVLENICS